MTKDQASDNQKKRYVIIGGVAGGMSAATRLRRLDPLADIVVFEKSGFVSYANCGLPYLVGGIITDEDRILLQTPESLSTRFNIHVNVGTEVLRIDRKAKVVEVHDRSQPKDKVRLEPYDYLIISTGASPARPPIEGLDGALTLRNVEDARGMMAAILPSTKSAVVIGGGFIGIEVAENLLHRNLDVTIVEAADHLLPPLDIEMVAPLERAARALGVKVLTSTSVEKIDHENKIVKLSNGYELPFDLVVASAGVRPNAQLAKDAGLKIGTLGGIVVDDDLRTSEPTIFAVGDVIEKSDFFDESDSLIPLANVANRQGRRAADVIVLGRKGDAKVAIGTAIISAFGITVASTGWSERKLVGRQIAFEAIHSHPNSHATYYPGAKEMAIKVLYRPSGELLGAQIVGSDGVDKRIDVLATALGNGMKVDELAELELAYAPQFGSAKDPINLIGYIGENRLHNGAKTVYFNQVEELIEENHELIDVRTPVEFAAGTIPGAKNIPLDEIFQRIGEIESGNPIVFCKVGQRGHNAAMFLNGLGIEARNLDGGITTYNDYLEVTRGKR